MLQALRNFIVRRTFAYKLRNKGMNMFSSFENFKAIRRKAEAYREDIIVHGAHASLTPSQLLIYKLAAEAAACTGCKHSQRTAQSTRSALKKSKKREAAFQYAWFAEAWPAITE